MSKCLSRIRKGKLEPNEKKKKKLTKKYYNRKYLKILYDRKVIISMQRSNARLL